MYISRKLKYMKKGIDWFNLMNQEEKEKYKSELSNVRIFYTFMDFKFDSFNQFISSSFIWNDSKFGHEYWSKLADKYE